MNGAFHFDVPNMDSEDAKLGMRQAARDLKSGDLRTSEGWAWYVCKISRYSQPAVSPAAWMRGYLLIALVKRRLDRQTANQIARLLTRDHYLIDWFPESWLTEVSAKYPKANDLVRAALRYRMGQ